MTKQTLEQHVVGETVRLIKELMPEFIIKIHFNDPMKTLQKFDEAIITHKITSWDVIKNILSFNINGAFGINLKVCLKH